jgi:branched-chain amino acid transport system substrate-binding protein
MITGPAYREFIEGLGPLADGVTSVTWWHHSTTYESDDVWGSTRAFYEDFKVRESSDPDYIHASSAAALVALQKAIETAGSLDPAKISGALRTLNLTTFYGPIVFDEHGMNAARDLPILQVQGQSVKVLFPASMAQAKLVMLK